MFDTLMKGFRSARQKLAGVQELNAEVIDAALRDVRLALLEADVELGVAKQFLAEVREKALGQQVQTRVQGKSGAMRVTPVEHFIKICQDELTAMMSDGGEALRFSKPPKITGIMMVGLQGSGKTTTSAKLAGLLQKQGKRPLLVAADLTRPAAVEQLRVLGEQLQVPVFSDEDKNPIEVCKKAIPYAKKLHCDTIVFDTAGRLAIDNALMQELADVRSAVEPDNVLLVVDSMIGQDSVRTAKAFHDLLKLDGVVLTKTDGDARGGAALSIRRVTGTPIRFIGTGEALDRIEPFRAEGMASRILGMGDVVGLVKDFENVVDQEKAETDAKRMLQGRLTLNDFMSQLEMLQNMGPLQGLLEKLPFFADSVPEGFQVDETEIQRVKAMVSSMTPDERVRTELFQKQPRRMERVAKGSGNSTDAVSQLLQRFDGMKQMMGQLGNQAGMFSKLPGLKNFAAANQMRQALSGNAMSFANNPMLQGMQGNPMFDQLAGSLFDSALAERGGVMPGQSNSPRAVLTSASQAKKKALRKAQKQARRKSRR